ncbi:hypothetical protein DRQ07_10005 [candidate division KSB1 bacterium]|nr:MAG: hypothetical protein DRQ07_10005 [candidate division KSB1 bacterium]
MKNLKITIVLLILVTGIANAQFNLYLEHRIPVKSHETTFLEFSSNGRFLSWGDSKGNLYIFDTSAGRTIHKIKAHWGNINTAVFDQQNSRLITGGQDGKICVWDLYSGRLENSIKGYGTEISDLALSPDDRMLAVVGKKKEVFIFEFPLGALKGKMKGHRKKVISAAFSTGGDQLLSVSEDRKMIIWDVNKLSLVRKTAIEARTITGSGIDIKSAAFSFDRKFIGVGIEEHVLAKGGRGMKFQYNLSFFDWETGAEIETLAGNRKNIDFFLISPDRKYAITDNSTLRNNRISFWNIQNGVIEQNYPMPGKLTCMAVSKNGKWFAAGYRDLNDKSLSHINIWQLSGMQGYKRFGTDQPVAVKSNRGFGSSIKITTPEEPLISYGTRKRIAVMTFDARGIETDVAQTTTYLIESKLGNSGLIELVERNQINKVLDELKYQQTGLTASNAADLGQHLNAEYILIGSINKLGNLLIITAKLVNVKTAQIEGTREVQCSNATIETISDMVSALAPTIIKF